MPTVVTGVTPQAGDGVFIITGQSQGGFYGSTAKTTVQAGSLFYNSWDWKFYTCADPLPGWAIPPQAGAGGSIWRWLAELYAASPTKPWARLIFAVAPVYGSRSSSWVPGQPNFINKAIGTNSALVGLGFTPTAYLWMNGPSDNLDIVAGTQAGGLHLANVDAMVTGLRSAGITTPVLMARDSVCRHNPATGLSLGPDFETLGQADRLNRLNAEAQIKNEQAWLAMNMQAKQAYDGAFMDNVSHAHRWDGVHIDSFGQYLAALMWMNKLLLYKGAGMI